MHKCNNCQRNTFDIINNFIDSLYNNCKRDFNLYLFDNGSDEVYNVPNYPNLEYEYIKDQYEFGLAKPLNDGVKKAIRDKCDIIILVNDDLTINSSINKFIDIIRKHEFNDVGIYGALTNGVLRNSHQRANKVGKGIKEITNEERSFGVLNGFLMAFTSKVYEKFKYKDNNLFSMNIKWGGGEIAFHNRIKPLGGRMFIIKDCWIYHIKLRDWMRMKL